MAIRLDADSPRESAKVHALKEDVRAAQEAIRFWEAALRDRVAVVEALDGWVAGTLATLLGTREDRLEEGVEQVREAQAHIAAARGRLERAKAAVVDGEAAQVAAADAEVERVMRLELAADGLRGTDHPAARELDEVELELEQARTSLPPLVEVFRAGTGLSAWLGALLVQVQHGTDQAMLDVGQVPMAGIRKMELLRRIQQQLGDLPQRTQRFEEACQTFGMSVTLGGDEPSAPSWVLDMVTDGWLADMHSLDRLSDLRFRLESMKADIAQALDPLDDQRQALMASVTILEARRSALLESLDLPAS